MGKVNGEIVADTGVVNGFLVWEKTIIRLGTGLQTLDDFRCAFKATGCRISEEAEDLFDMFDFTVAAKKTEADIVVAPVGALGFRGKVGAYYEDICDRAQEEFDFGLCPPELGLQMCLQLQRFQCKDELFEGKRFHIGMKPIASAGGCYNIFHVEYDGEFFWLSNHWFGSHDHHKHLRYFHSDELFVFVDHLNSTHLHLWDRRF